MQASISSHDLTGSRSISNAKPRKKIPIPDSVMSDTCALPLPMESSSPSPPRRQLLPSIPSPLSLVDVGDESADATLRTQNEKKMHARSYPMQHHHQQSRNKVQTNVIIVVNVLPLVFERNATDSGWDVEWSSSATSMFYRNLVSDTKHYRPLFIGCPEVFIPHLEESTVEMQLRPFHCVPVFLDPIVAHRYFQGFCKGVLWPIFHNVVDVYNSARLTLDEFKTPPPPTPSETNTKSDEDESPSVHSPRRGSNSTWCDPASWNPAAQDTCWVDYCSVNRTFAKRIVESYHDGTIIWIHDYPFLMLPSYLLRTLRTVPIVALYLHVPFPSSEIFRCLAMRTEILRAMLCADHIGFLIFEHARHFLTSCKRLLGLNYKTSANGMLVVEYNGRKVYISCSHIEPDVSYLHTIMDTTERNEQLKKNIERFVYDSKKQRKFVITSVDRLEGLNALPLKLRAFDRFLALHPSKRTSVVLVQIGLSLDSRPNDYHQTRDYVQRFVTEINRRWSSSADQQVVYYEEKPKTTCAERMSLWRMSDVFLDTSVRSGLSLLPFEYLVAQKRNMDHYGMDPTTLHQFGCMIVSEFASYSRVLNGCLLINPWKTDDIVSALVKATEMQYYEKFNRFQLNYNFLVIHSETRWAERLLADFEMLEQKKQQTNSLGGESVEVGFGFDFRVMQFTAGFVKLNTDDVVKISTKCTQRLFIFDYGGTLSWTTSILEEGGAAHYYQHRGDDVQTLNDSSVSSNGIFEVSDRKTAFGQEVIRFIDGQVRTPLSVEARENMRTLCSDSHNIVFVISTGRKSELEAEFGDIPQLNLIADNGFFLKKAGSSWECLYSPEELDMNWKDEVKRVMQAYAARTNGAYLIITEASLLYDYRNCDLEYGEIQALELYEQLRHVIKKGAAAVRRAKGFIEVHHIGVNKAVAVSLILNHLKEEVNVPEFVMYTGDDESDEMAFKSLHAFADKEPDMKHVFTCTVGMKPSAAKCYVDSVTDVLATIHAIATRLRLESHRSSGSLFAKKEYFEQFIMCGNLVRPGIFHLLSLENMGADIGDALDAKEASPRTVAKATRLSRPEIVSSLEHQGISTSTLWYSVGAGVAMGTLLGIVVATQSRPLRQKFQHWLFGTSST